MRPGPEGRLVRNAPEVPIQEAGQGGGLDQAGDRHRISRVGEGR